MKNPTQIIAAMLMALMLLMLPNKFVAQTTHSATTVEAVLTGINAFRATHGLKPLQLDSYISQQAKDHSLLMAENKIKFGHGGFSERTNNLYKKFPHARSMAENVAYADLDNTKAIITSWLNSSGHRKNIMGNFNFTGIGVARNSNGRVYVTQIFVRDLQ